MGKARSTHFMGNSMGPGVVHSMRHSGETSSLTATSESTTSRRCALPVLQSASSSLICWLMHSADVSCMSAHLAQQSGNLKLLVSTLAPASHSHEHVPPHWPDGSCGKFTSCSPTVGAAASRHIEVSLPPRNADDRISPRRVVHEPRATSSSKQSLLGRSEAVLC